MIVLFTLVVSCCGFFKFWFGVLVALNFCKLNYKIVTVNWKYRCSKGINKHENALVFCLEIK